MKTVNRKFNVYGMSCAACAARVETAVKNLDGVFSVTVSLLTNEMAVVKSEDLGDAAIVSAVQKAGYNAVIAKKEGRTADTAAQKETAAYLKRLVPSAIILLVVMYFSMGASIGLHPAFLQTNEGVAASVIVQAAAALAVMIINRKFFISGTKSLIRLAPNMDSLVTLGSGTSFIYSAVVAVGLIAACLDGGQNVHELSHGLYFEGAAMIVTLITLGKTLESFSKGKTTNSINALIALAPDTATVISDGEERIIPIEEVKAGDVIAVKTGGYVPVDAVILSGSGWIDQSSMTGESVPVEKLVGDTVFCGTVNTNGYFTARAEKVGEDTSLGKIIEIVKNVNLSKAPIAKIADRVSGIFVPAVLAVSLITLAIWLIAGETAEFAVQRAVAVLLISCPCALGLATPVAIMVGSGVAAKNGILFKSATSLENLGKISAIVFDKTGTLTEGKPSVTDVILAPDTEKERLLKLAASLEKMSEHPLAKAVTAYFSGEVSDAEDFVTLSGLGLKATIGGEEIIGGNIKLMTFAGVDVSVVKAEADALLKQGKTVMYFAANGKLLGAIAVSDREKSTAIKAIEGVRALGVTPYLLTGDNKAVADATAQRLGIDKENVFADTLPDGKADIIRSIKETALTAMVGDGVNDAPSLSVSDVGITLENGSFIATEAAQVMVLGEIENVVTAIDLSRKVIRNVKQNLFWAFIYNVICIPVAAGALYPAFAVSLSPMIAAGAMSLSSLFVVTNALRLNLYRPKINKSCDGACPIAQNDNSIDLKEKKEMYSKTFTVTGMMCAHCEARVKAAVESIDGIKKCVPDHQKNTAVIFSDTPIDDEKIISAIKAQGYDAN